MDGNSFYVACLASYNAGILYGGWISADQTAESMLEEVKKLLSNSSEKGAEEWGVHDYDMRNYKGEECPDLKELAAIGALISSTHEHERDLADRLISLIEEGISNTIIEALIFDADNFCGEFDSWAHYAEEHIEETYGLSSINEALLRYFNFESLGRDLSYELTSITVNDKFYIYHNS